MTENRSRLIDSFTFFNERELCEFRMRLLDPFVDCFVVVEADVTHTGIEKDFNFQSLLQSTLREFRDKIVYYPAVIDVEGLDLDYRPETFDGRSAHWRIEMTQRNAIDAACGGFAENDLLVISDVDEIPDPEVLLTIAREPAMVAPLPVALQQHFFYYNLSNLRNEDWRGSVVTTVGRSRASSAQWHRNERWQMDYVPAAGWHLSFFGGAARIREKVQSFAHQEYNVEGYTSDTHISRRLADGADLFDRGTQMTKTDESFFPPHFLKAAAAYRDFLW